MDTMNRSKAGKSWKETDEAGLRVMPGHAGLHGPTLGEDVWLLENKDNGALYGWWPTRHDAVAALAVHASGGGLKNHNRGKKMRAHSRDWFEPIPVPVGAIRFEDVTFIEWGERY